MENGRLNCWEYQECGREPGGRKVDELGPCPAATEHGLHGSNGGDMGGRSCWVVAGTLCEGHVCGNFQEKYVTCHKCAFYKRVEIEEGLDYIADVDLLIRYGNAAATE